MRRCRIIAGIFLSLVCASCGQDKPDSSSSPAALSSPAAAPAKGSPAAAANGNNTNVTIPPAGAQWTIYCIALPGPDHVERAKEMEDILKQSTKMPNWYLVHEDQQSTLYYGYYKTNDDAHLKADRQKIMAMADQTGNKPFGGALPVLIASPDPVAPAEYSLLKAKGYWSLQVAAYEGPGRKEAAVESVIEARKQGVEAYYHHGESVSEVCVGAWPEEAIKKQDADTGSAENQDQPILVLGPGGHLPESMTRGLRDKETNQEVRVLEQKVEVLDPTMIGMMQKFPSHSVNGVEDTIQVTDPNTHQIISQAKPSFIVQIPHTEPTALQQGVPANQPNLIDPNAPSSNGLGTLR